MTEHPEFKYLVCDIDTNPNITIDELIEYAKINNIDPYSNFEDIGANKSITIEDIKKYPNFKCGYRRIFFSHFLIKIMLFLTP